MTRPKGDVLTCSFCGKAQHQVLKLIAGPGVYICEQCVDLCNDILADELGRRPTHALDSKVEAAARAALDAVDRLRMLAKQRRDTPPPEPDEPDGA